MPADFSCVSNKLRVLQTPVKHTILPVNITFDISSEHCKLNTNLKQLSDTQRVTSVQNPFKS